ncbi:hypothetical protein SAMN02745664_106101 [Moraxella cuniculi DSM 21768]|uniref:Uncharacterized protein n=1 Tax=Moraxella cuniculi DSM 21768 TaxID=1122245 RepID=A0A1N7EPZ3_9GAMM|nr:hypothetical protein SAMN02745664_106101 [Moraxella cuniculi DSM 21768]
MIMEDLEMDTAVRFLGVLGVDLGSSIGAITLRFVIIQPNLPKII